MKQANAYKASNVLRSRAVADKFSVEGARHAYISSPGRIDLAKLLQKFAELPVDVDLCGESSKRK